MSGRPRLEPDASKVCLRVRLTRVQVQQLAAVSADMGLSLSSLLRAALNEYLEDMGDPRPFSTSSSSTSR